MWRAFRSYDLRVDPGEEGVSMMRSWQLSCRGCVVATAVVALALPCSATALAPNARPQGGIVVAGSASIGQGVSTTTIDQASQRATINWPSFDVGSQQTVTVDAPSASAVILMRVIGPDPSQIAGQVKSNGQVVITNAAGVDFYAGAQSTTGGLLVSAAGISTLNFMAGNLVFGQAPRPNATVTNAGTITVGQAGVMGMLAPAVVNQGVITATLGSVALLGAKTATLDLYGDGLVAPDDIGPVTAVPIGMNGKPRTALVTQTGSVSAGGGSIELQGSAASGLIATLDSDSGTISAQTVGAKPGSIVFGAVGGGIRVGGTLRALGGAPGETAGTIQLLATGTVALGAHANVSASGQAGGGTVAIGTTVARAAGGPSVTSTTTSANVRVPAGATVAANATADGSGGHITMLSTTKTVLAGAASATGGPAGGNGGVIEISGATVVLTGTTDLSAPNGQTGTLLLDPHRLIL
jgi:filamentous hemagglutinin family protein